MQQTVLQELHQRYGGSYYHLLNGLKREIQYLKPFRESYIAMRQHYESISLNLQKLEEYIQYQHECDYKYSQIDEKNFGELESSMNIEKYNLGKSKLEKDNLELEKKVIKQKIDDLCDIIKFKVKEKDDLLNKYAHNTKQLQKVENDTAVLKVQNKNLNKEIQGFETQVQGVTSHKAKVQNIISELQRENIHLQSQIYKIKDINNNISQKVKGAKEHFNILDSTLIPQKMALKDKQSMKTLSLKREIESKTQKLALTKSQLQLQVMKGKQMQQHIQNIIKITSTMSSNVQKTKYQMNDKIEVELYREKVTQEQNKIQIANIKKYIESLEQTNELMLQKMSEICSQDRGIINTIFVDKCKMLNEAAQKIQNVGSIIKQRNRGQLRDISNNSRISQAAQKIGKKSQITNASYGQNDQISY